MTDIVHDYAEIAKALKGDNWWKPKPKPVVIVPLTEMPFDNEMLKPSGVVKVKTPLPFGLGYRELRNASNRRS